MDKGEFYTAALQLCGAREYVPGSTPGTLCDLHGQRVIRFALDYARWTFATRCVRLALHDGRGMLPADCLRLQDCSLVDAGGYDVFGREVVAKASGTSECELVYTSDLTAQAVELPDYEPLFCEACSLLLAARLAPALTSNFQLAAEYEQRGMSMLAMAKLKDAQTINMQQFPLLEEFRR